MRGGKREKKRTSSANRWENISYAEYRLMIETSISKKFAKDVQRDSKEVGNMVTPVKLLTLSGRRSDLSIGIQNAHIRTS